MNGRKLHGSAYNDRRPRLQDATGTKCWDKNGRHKQGLPQCKLLVASLSLLIDDSRGHAGSDAWSDFAHRYLANLWRALHGGAVGRARVGLDAAWRLHSLC